MARCKAVIKGKVCGQGQDALDHTHDAFDPAESHKFEPEDAAPAPKECGALLGFIDDSAVYCHNVTPCHHQAEKGGECCDNDPQKECKCGGVKGQPSCMFYKAGARVAGASEYLPRDYDPPDPELPPAAGQSGAEQWLIAKGYDPVSAEAIVADVEAYAAHVTKGLKARLPFCEAHDPKDCDVCPCCLAVERDDAVRAAEARNVELMGELERERAENTKDLNALVVKHNDNVALREELFDVKERLAEAQKALRNLIALATPHFSDATQMLALSEARAALTEVKNG